MRSCAVLSCRSSSSRNPDGLSFFNFPKNEDRRNKWIEILQRERKDGTPWTPTESSRMCSRHFISGKPSRDPINPDYYPTLFLGNDPEPRIMPKKTKPSTPQRDVPLIPDSFMPHTVPSNTDFTPNLDLYLPPEFPSPQFSSPYSTPNHTSLSPYNPDKPATDKTNSSDVGHQITLSGDVTAKNEQITQTDLISHHLTCLEQEVLNLRSANVMLINHVTSLNLHVQRQQLEIERCHEELKKNSEFKKVFKPKTVKK